jgi:hypothetical protein
MDPMRILGALVVVWMAGTALVYLGAAVLALWRQLLRVQSALAAPHTAALPLAQDSLQDHGLRGARGFAIGITVAASVWTIWVLVTHYGP